MRDTVFDLNEKQAPLVCDVCPRPWRTRWMFPAWGTSWTACTTQPWTCPPGRSTRWLVILQKTNWHWLLALSDSLCRMLRLPGCLRSLRILKHFKVTLVYCTLATSLTALEIIYGGREAAFSEHKTWAWKQRRIKKRVEWTLPLSVSSKKGISAQWNRKTTALMEQQLALKEGLHSPEAAIMPQSHILWAMRRQQKA